MRACLCISAYVCVCVCSVCVWGWGGGGGIVCTYIKCSGVCVCVHTRTFRSCVKIEVAVMGSPS